MFGAYCSHSSPTSIVEREFMKQQPGENASRSLRARRTQPALPGVTLSTTPVTTPQLRNGTAPPQPQSAAKKRPARSAMWKLLSLGLLLALLYLALYPLFDGSILDHQPARQALLGAFPWVKHLYWTAWTPLARALGHIAIFNLNTPA